MKKIMILLLILIFIGGCKMDNTKVRMETNMGVMEFKLYDDLVPETAGNFKKLVEEGFYDGQRFHRIIENFMVQGGDPLSKDVANTARWGTGGPGYAINDEFVDELRHNKPGLLSMANSGPNSGGSQFFITLVPTPHLDGKHAIFGEIINGEDVLSKIGSVETDGADRPVNEVIVEKVSII